MHTPNPEPTDAPVLSYATFDADGLPPAIPEVDAMLAAGEPVKKMRRHFRRADETARYVAKSLRWRFFAEQVGDQCEICGQPTRGLITPLDWKVIVRNKFGELTLSRTHAEADTRTHHAICPACWKPWHRRLAWLRWASYFHIILSWTLLPAWIVVTHSRSVRSILPSGSSYSILIIMLLYAAATLITKPLLVIAAPRIAPLAIRMKLPKGLQFLTLNPPEARGAAPAEVLP